jgi:hypothetical protein
VSAMAAEIKEEKYDGKLVGSSIFCSILFRMYFVSICQQWQPISKLVSTMEGSSMYL